MTPGQPALTPGHWYRPTGRLITYRGSQSVWSTLDPHGPPGIYRTPRSGTRVCISPYAIDRVRRYPGTPLRVDIVLKSALAGEEIRLDYADADAIAKAINKACGYPQPAIKTAIFDLILELFRQVAWVEAADQEPAPNL